MKTRIIHEKAKCCVKPRCRACKFSSIYTCSPSVNQGQQRKGRVKLTALLYWSNQCSALAPFPPVLNFRDCLWLRPELHKERMLDHDSQNGKTLLESEPCASSFSRCTFQEGRLNHWHRHSIEFNTACKGFWFPLILV